MREADEMMYHDIKYHKRSEQKKSIRSQFISSLLCLFAVAKSLSELCLAAFVQIFRLHIQCVSIFCCCVFAGVVAVVVASFLFHFTLFVHSFDCLSESACIWYICLMMAMMCTRTLMNCQF